jgi:hypothetical protein
MLTVQLNPLYPGLQVSYLPYILQYISSILLANIWSLLQFRMQTADLYPLIQTTDLFPTTQTTDLYPTMQTSDFCQTVYTIDLYPTLQTSEVLANYADNWPFPRYADIWLLTYYAVFSPMQYSKCYKSSVQFLCVILETYNQLWTLRIQQHDTYVSATVSQ